MKPFHIYLYGPSTAAPQLTEQVSRTGPYRTSFEQAVARLETIAGISLEPDGSFGFVSHAGQERLFGMLYDAGGILQYCELQGHVSLTAWRDIAAAISGEKLVLAQLVVLQLPDRTLKSFQLFESETWPGDPSSAGI